MSRTCNCVVGDKKLYDIVVRKYLGKQSHIIRGPFDKFVDWRKCAAVMQR